MRKIRYYKALVASTISKPNSNGHDRGIQSYPEHPGYRRSNASVKPRDDNNNAPADVFTASSLHGIEHSQLTNRQNPIIRTSPGRVVTVN